MAIAIIGLTLLAGCGQAAGSAGQSHRPSTRQVLRFPVGTDFGTLDPAYLDTQTDAEIAQNLYDGLLDQANDLHTVPGISSMPSISPDGLTYTFRLRHDVAFWNGDRVTAKDVLYSWNRAAAMVPSRSRTVISVTTMESLSQRHISRNPRTANRRKLPWFEIRSSSRSTFRQIPVRLRRRSR